MNWDLTKGPVVKSMLMFAIPMILGDLLQQCYNIADTLIVGQFLGRDALAAVGSAFTLMTFLTSILLGLCMGSGALVSMRFGQRDEQALRENLCASFLFIALVSPRTCPTISVSAMLYSCCSRFPAIIGSANSSSPRMMLPFVRSRYMSCLSSFLCDGSLIIPAFPPKSNHPTAAKRNIHLPIDKVGITCYSNANQNSRY